MRGEAIGFPREHRWAAGQPRERFAAHGVGGGEGGGDGQRRPAPGQAAGQPAERGERVERDGELTSGSENSCPRSCAGLGQAGGQIVRGKNVVATYVDDVVNALIIASQNEKTNGQVKVVGE